MKVISVAEIQLFEWGGKGHQFSESGEMLSFDVVCWKTWRTSLGCTTYIWDTGTCHREGYLFSRYWYENGINFTILV